MFYIFNFNVILFSVLFGVVNIYNNGLPSEEEARLAQEYFNSLPDAAPVNYESQVNYSVNRFLELYPEYGNFNASDEFSEDELDYIGIDYDKESNTADFLTNKRQYFEVEFNSQDRCEIYSYDPEKKTFKYVTTI